MSSVTVFLACTRLNYQEEPWCKVKVVTAPEQVAGYCGGGLYWEILDDPDEGSELSVAVREVLGSYAPLSAHDVISELVRVLKLCLDELKASDRRG